MRVGRGGRIAAGAVLGLLFGVTAATAETVVPVNGGTPANISNTTQPSE